MKPLSWFLLVALMCCISISSCSQIGSSRKLDATDVFVGSTPCNQKVNALFKIPSADTCMFMKWQLNTFNKANQKDSFKLLISYGDYQPNTMHFLGGGKNLSLAGKITVSYSMKNNSRYTIYRLTADKNGPELLFIELDNNILHLTDSNMKFIKGDASFGFVLNRLNALQSN
jgi:hypothetical protein